ncbi:MAG TPA: MerR family transcriptional regulator [Jatrophihabitantaceae bacterium]|nr:MerR family transcriptional regulator [Jatrophihabitantaceae bacterium]
MTAARPREARSGGVSIGDVLSQLRAEFPDITISKIRFLETEGLVAPERTASGYRKFTAADVARLRYVLAQQRDNYLPLRVIKDQLDAIDRGLVPPGAGGMPPVSHLSLADSAPVADYFRPAPVVMRLSREELLNATGLHAEQLAELEQFGLIAARPGGHYDDDALAIGKVVAEMARFGIEGRHLRPFRSAADREIGLFAQVVGPMARQRGPEARSRADETVRELASLSVRLHAALVQIGLRDATGSGG